MLIIPIVLAQVGVGWLFIRYLINRDRGAKEPGPILFLAGVFGALATVGALFLESWLVSEKVLAGVPHLSAGFLLTNALKIGAIEECLKVLPLAIFLYKKRYFNEVTDGLIYFGIAGMTFGILENISYSLAFGSAAGLLRLLTVPFLHAGFCVLFGWLLARKKVLKEPWAYVALALLAAIGLHGLYDFGLMYQHPLTILMSFAITISVNLAIFRIYRRAERSDIKLGLSTDQANWYCTHCGMPNPERFLHCTNCGKKL